jgi:hypothetical protein
MKLDEGEDAPVEHWFYDNRALEDNAKHINGENGSNHINGEEN